MDLSRTKDSLGWKSPHRLLPFTTTRQLCASGQDSMHPVAPEDRITSHDTLAGSALAIITTGELFGGVERHILGMLVGLQQSGLVPILLLFHDRELAEQARTLGVNPIFLPSANSKSITAARQLADISRKRDVRIVHVHGYKATVISGIARLLQPFSIVKTEHGLPEPMQGRPLQAFRENLYRGLDAWVVKRYVSTVCYVTNDLKSYYESMHENVKYAVIQNGIENYERAATCEPDDLSKEHFNLLLIGRIDTVKGHEYAIRALVSGTVPHDVQLYVIGVGPQQSRLESLVTTLKLEHRVHFLGFRRNILDYIAHADALIMPSIHEGLPYTLIETMALGTPIIASKVGGLEETLDDMTTALLIPVGDATALAAAISRLYHDNELAAQISRNARELQRSSFSLSTMVARYKSVYEDVIQSSGCAGGAA